MPHALYLDPKALAYHYQWTYLLCGECTPGYDTHSSLTVSLCTLTWCQTLRPALISTMGFVYPFLLQSNEEQSSFSPG